MSESAPEDALARNKLRHEARADEISDDGVLAVIEAAEGLTLTQMTAAADYLKKRVADEHAAARRRPTEGIQTCGRRMSGFGPWDRAEGLDTWRIERNGDRCCSFCGSLREDDFLRLLEEAADPDSDTRVEKASGKNYKFYVHRRSVPNALAGGIKFYAWHITKEGAAKLNEAWPNAADESQRKWAAAYAALR